MRFTPNHRCMFVFFLFVSVLLLYVKIFIKKLCVTRENFTLKKLSRSIPGVTSGVIPGVTSAALMRSNAILSRRVGAIENNSKKYDRKLYNHGKFIIWNRKLIKRNMIRTTANRIEIDNIKRKLEGLEELLDKFKRGTCDAEEIKYRSNNCLDSDNDEQCEGEYKCAAFKNI
jgi:hypothetical protein